MSETMTLPNLKDFPQHLEELLDHDRRKFASMCRSVWPRSARQMCDGLAEFGYDISEGKCLYIRNASRNITARDERAIKYIIKQIGVQQINEIQARLDAF